MSRPGFISRCAGSSRSVRALLLAGVLLMSSLGAAGRATASGTGELVPHADDGAYISHVRHIDRRTFDLMVESPAMRSGMPVRIILPEHWRKEPKSTFPVLYLLQGASDDYTSWTRETDVEELSDSSDVLVVMPEGGRAGFYADWWDYGSSTGPHWETFHTEELPQLMERAFRAGSSRAVIGLSEGGLGALNYAARHPGSYRFVGSLSGIVDISDPVMQFAIGVTCLREDVDPVRLWGHPDEQREIWDAHNPSRMASRFKNTWVYLYAATGAPGGLEQGFNPAASLLELPLAPSTYAFSRALRRAKVKVTTNLFEPGTHSWPYWQRELHRMWPLVLTALGAR